MNYHVIAAGDLFNDTAMLKEANVGLLFRAPDGVKKDISHNSKQWKPTRT